MQAMRANVINGTIRNGSNFIFMMAIIEPSHI